jgi:hypothetical protein
MAGARAQKPAAVLPMPCSRRMFGVEESDGDREVGGEAGQGGGFGWHVGR